MNHPQIFQEYEKISNDPEKYRFLVHTSMSKPIVGKPDRPTLKVQLFPGIGDDRMPYTTRGNTQEHPDPKSTKEQSNGNVAILRFIVN